MKSWKGGRNVIIAIKVMKVDVLGGQYSIKGDENRLEMLSLLAIVM